MIFFGTLISILLLNQNFAFQTLLIELNLFSLIRNEKLVINLDFRYNSYMKSILHETI